MKSVQDEEGFNQGWSGGLSTRIRAERRCELLASVMDPAPHRRVLEIGCGRGEIACQLGASTGMEVLGIDRSAKFVEEANQRNSAPNVRFSSMDFMSPGNELDEGFDYIVGNGILHHLYYGFPQALASIKLLLKDGGRIAFLEPNLHNPYVYLIFSFPRLRRVARLEPDEMAFSRRFASEALTVAGFRSITIEYRDFLIPGVPDWMIDPLVRVGSWAEGVPVIKHLAQSLFISAAA